MRRELRCDNPRKYLENLFILDKKNEFLFYECLLGRNPDLKCNSKPLKNLDLSACVAIFVG